MTAAGLLRRVGPRNASNAMAKPLRSLVRRTFFARRGNLVALDEPYATMARLLHGRRVQGMVDAGASDGRTALRLLRHFPEATAHLFEPHPDYVAALEALAAADARIRVQRCALSDVAGAADLFATRGRGQTSLHRPNRRNVAVNRAGASIDATHRVRVVTLDDWWCEAGDPPIELLKLDIQAGELGALRGAARLLRRCVLLVYTEVFFNPMYEGGALFSEIDLWLRECGFVLHNFFGPRTDARDSLLRANAIYLHEERMG